VQSIKKDGNCFFRALSFVLSGTEENYKQLRLVVTNHMMTINQQLLPHTQRNVSSYLEATRMRADRVWATDVEIFAAASLFGVDIIVYTQYGSNLRWLRFCSSFNQSIHATNAILMQNLNLHFEPIISLS